MSILNSIKKQIELPFKFSFFYRNYKNKKFTLLDVGCGNHSPQQTKRYFPFCIYHGLDNEIYNNDSSDLSLMEKFHKINLESNAELELLPNEFYDIIILSHVIEHLTNGLEIIKILTAKLKRGGIIFIEFPSVKSLSLPHMKGTLNFCDDTTHKRLYDLREIGNLLLSKNFKIAKAGKRRYWRRIFLMPLIFLKNFNSPGGAFWDLLGFAEFIYAYKPDA